MLMSALYIPPALLQATHRHAYMHATTDTQHKHTHTHPHTQNNIIFDGIGVTFHDGKRTNTFPKQNTQFVF